MSGATFRIGRGHRQAVSFAWPRSGMVGSAGTGDPMVHTACGIGSDARILSDRGLVAACDLVAGDRVADGCGGWVALAAVLRIRTDIGAERVTIPAGALGGGLPSTDLVVGRETRLRLRSAIARRLVGSAETLLAADQLVTLIEGVTLAPGIMCDTTHLVFEEHAMFVANDVVIEGLIPSPRFIASLSLPDAATIRDALPKLRYEGALAAYEPHLPDLDDREARHVLSAGSTFGANPGRLAGEPERPAEGVRCPVSGTSAPSPLRPVSGL